MSLVVLCGEGRPAILRLSAYQPQAGIPRDRGRLVVGVLPESAEGIIPLGQMHDTIARATREVELVRNNFNTQTEKNKHRRIEDNRESWFTGEEVELAEIYLECAIALMNEDVVICITRELTNCIYVLQNLSAAVNLRMESETAFRTRKKEGDRHCKHCPCYSDLKRGWLCMCKEACLPGTSECIPKCTKLR